MTNQRLNEAGSLSSGHTGGPSNLANLALGRRRNGLEFILHTPGGLGAGRGGTQVNVLGEYLSCSSGKLGGC